MSVLTLAQASVIVDAALKKGRESNLAPLAVAVLDNGARQGKNDFGRIGYGGPCPPPGKPHRYYFKLFALDARLDLKAGASRSELEQAGKRHVLAQTKLMGTYKR